MTADTSRISLAQALSLDIQERYRADWQTRVKVNPRNQPILSDLPDCDRQVVYGVTHWQEREPIPAEVMPRLEAGNIWEREVIKQLQALGYTVILEQMPVEIRGRDKSLLARGKIDGVIIYHGQKIPFEIKSMSPMVFDRVNTLADLQRKAYLRKYLRQLQLYLFGNNVEQGIFVLTNGLGSIKVLPMDLDYGECELLLQRLENANRHIQAKTLPDRIAYSQDICDRCPFIKTCLPDMLRAEAEPVVDDELVAQLERREALKEFSKEYADLDESIKSRFRPAGAKKYVAGDYVVDVRVLETKEKVIPAGTQTRVQIKKL